MALGTVPQPEGLGKPPIDDLMKNADSKFALAMFAAKRARQINSYFNQINEGFLQNVGPLVEYRNGEKILSIAFQEIDEGLVKEKLGRDEPIVGETLEEQHVYIDPNEIEISAENISSSDSSEDSSDGEE